MAKNINIIREEVESLYNFRDAYFTNYGMEEAKDKDNRVEERLKKTIEIIDNIKDDINSEHRGEVYYLKGRALNIGPDYSEVCEQELGKATKFNLPESWNELGECLYKKNDLIGAKTCFERAISLKENKVFLRNMSMLMRSMPWKDSKEREENITKGLEFARSALKEDVDDGNSWLVLGNAYLSLFFTGGTRLDVLKNSKASYAKAENDKLTVLLPELHYSKFQVQWYEEEYTNALNSLWRAQELEPSWKECQSKYENSCKFLKQLHQLSTTFGQLNQRRINNLINDIKPNQLGPYEKGGTSVTDNSKPILVAIKELNIGGNKDKIVQGKVVCTLFPESGIPFSFCLVDKDRTCIAVTVYNWADGFGVKIGDSVAVVAPVLKNHSITFKHDNQNVEFKSLRVIAPIMLVVNKRRIMAGQVAVSQIVCEQKTS